MKCCGNLDINHKVLHRLLKLDFECIGACYTTLHATYLSSFPCRNEKKVNDSPTLTNYTAAAESTFCVLLFFAQFFLLESRKNESAALVFYVNSILANKSSLSGSMFFIISFFVPFSMPITGAHMVGISRNRKQSTSLQSNMKVDIK